MASSLAVGQLKAMLSRIDIGNGFGFWKTIPILLRLDYIMRYRGYLAASLVAGFSF